MLIKSIGELLTHICVLSVMPDEERVAEYLVESFVSIPGVRNIGVNIDRYGIRRGDPCYACCSTYDECKNRCVCEGGLHP